jgi:hypothetical protein
MKDMVLKSIFFLGMCAVPANAQSVSEIRANCIKEVTGLDPYINGRLRNYPQVHEQAIFTCVQKAETAPKPIPSQAIETKRPPGKSTTQPKAVDKDTTTPTKNAKEALASKDVSTKPNLITKTPDAIFVDDVQLFFTGGGAVDVVTFVPLLQAAKNDIEGSQIDAGPAVSALKEHLNSNQAFQTFYTQLMSRRADELKQEKEKLLLTVKNAEKPITDYIRANLNAPNLNQYLDAVKMIGTANSDTSSDNLKTIIDKISSLNPAYAHPQPSNKNATEQKALAPTQNISTANTTSSDNDFNSIFPSGIYAKTEKDCARYLANPKQMRMNERFERVTIEGREISRYSTNGCTVRGMTGSGPAYNISADCTEEGDTSKQKYVFSTRDGKFNFGLFDELGKTWWHLCGKNTSSNAALPPNPSTASLPQREVSVGSKCGDSVEITKISGIDTLQAEFEGKINKKIAEEACSCNAPGGELKGRRLDMCVRDELHNAKIFKAKADCIEGMITDSNGYKRKLTGRIRGGSPELIDVVSRQIVETMSASGYTVTLSQLSVLCPSRVNGKM